MADKIAGSCRGRCSDLLEFCVNIPAAGAAFGEECRSLFVGDFRKGEKARVIKSKLKDGFRVKPLTNILQEWNKKSNDWEDVGHYRTFIPSGQEAFVGGDGAGLILALLKQI